MGTIKVKLAHKNSLYSHIELGNSFTVTGEEAVDVKITAEVIKLIKEGKLVIAEFPSIYVKYMMSKALR